MNSHRFMCLLALGIVAVAGAGPSAFAQDKGKKPAAAAAAPAAKGATSAKLVSGPWNLECHPAGPEQKLVCEVSKKIALEKTRKILLTVFVTPRNAGKGAEAHVLRYQLPHGLNLTSGVKVQIDKGEALSPIIVTTSQAGVFARLGMNAVLLGSLKKGSIMKVDFAAMNGTSLSIPVSLQGFSAVYDKLK
jgi:invasion protein IalB